MSQLGGNNEQMSQLDGQMSQLDLPDGEQYVCVESVDSKDDKQISQLGENNEQMSQLGGQMSQLPESVLRVKAAKKVSQEAMEMAICDLCRNRWVTSVEMAKIFGREKRTLLRILRPMVNHHLLKAREQQQKHPQQAYQTTEEKQN